MKLELFAFVVAADFALLLGVAISALIPRFRIWPPPKKDSWHQWVSWTLFTIDMFGVPFLGVLDFESLGYGHWSRFLIGGLAVAIGLGIDVWGTRTLTAQQSLGGKGKIVTEGPYRYTRNPQYVGFIFLFSGIILITYSLMALTTGLLILVLFLILPFSEEPWLRQQYGKDYEEYCEKVPRFVGFRSFRTRKQLTNYDAKLTPSANP